MPRGYFSPEDPAEPGSTPSGGTDFDAYVKRRMGVANMGRFSSDRAIAEYAKDIRGD